MTTALLYETFILRLNAFGLYQKTRVSVLVLIAVIIPICSLTSVFALQKVDHKCYIEAREREPYSNLNQSTWEKLAYPPKSANADPSCSMYDPSFYANHSYSIPGHDFLEMHERQIVPCDVYIVEHNNEGEHTATGDFEIFCEREAVRQTGTALLFLGKGIGLAVGGQVADVFGRQRLLVVLQVLLVFVSGLTVFVPNLQLLLVARFAMGFSYATNYLLAFTIVCEMLLPQHIALLGYMFEAAFGVGMALLACLAYFFQNWRHLQMAATVAGLPSILIALWCPESLRWLVSSGNFEKARDLVIKIAKANKVEFDLGLEDDLRLLCQLGKDNGRGSGGAEDAVVPGSAGEKNRRSSFTVAVTAAFSDLPQSATVNENSTTGAAAGTPIPVACFTTYAPPVVQCRNELRGASNYAGNLQNSIAPSVDNVSATIIEVRGEKKADKPSIFLILEIFKRPKLRTRVSVLAFCWCVISAVYYGIMLAGKMIPGSLYLNTAVGGLLEVPAMIVAYLVSSKLGRKWLLVISLVTTGVSCALITVTNVNELQRGSQLLAQIGRFGISICFGVIYVYTLELIPTCARTTGMSFCSMAARVGAIITPYGSLLSDMIWEPLGFLVYGSFALVAAAMMAITLPETFNKPLQNSYEDAIIFDSDNQKIHHPGAVHVESAAVAVPGCNLDGFPEHLKESDTSMEAPQDAEDRDSCKSNDIIAEYTTC